MKDAVTPSQNSLPDSLIVADRGPISALFANYGLTSFKSAVQRVGELPYGRTTDRADFRLVLIEGRGACSGKHALLAALARELNLEIELMVGIYEMNEVNTPGVGVVLKKSGLESIPEAHCYLRYRGLRFDVTLGAEPETPSQEFLFEARIHPEDIGETKVNLHRKFLARWIENNNHCDLEGIWEIREACISALAGHSSRRFRHALVIGGTGMLARCVLGLANNAETLSVIGRNPEKLQSLGKRCRSAFEALAVDYRYTEKVLASVRDVVSRRGAIDLVVAWIHADAPNVPGAIANLAAAGNSAVEYYDILGSAYANPSNSIRLDDRRQAIEAAGVTNYRQIVLGYVLEGLGARWLTNVEISVGVLKAIGSGSLTSIVGVVSPWKARPG